MIRVWHTLMAARGLGAVVLVILPSALAIESRFFDPRDDFTDQGITGPYEAIMDGETTDGRARFKAGSFVSQVQAGERVGWISSVCLREGTSMMAQAVLAYPAGKQKWPGRQFLITPDLHRCGPAFGSIEVPEDGPAGRYEIRRLGIVRPMSWMPLTASLSSLSFPVTAGHPLRLGE